MKRIIIIAVGIVIIMLVAVALLMFSTSAYWEEETGFGAWGQDIILEYVDGETQSLKILADNPLSSVYLGGREVKGMYYHLSAKAEGTGYSNVELDLSNYNIKYRFRTGNSIIDDYTLDPSSSTVTVPVNGQWKEIIKHRSTPNQFAPGYTTVDPGTYTIDVAPTGRIRYNPDGEGWQDAPIPSTITINVEIRDDKSLTITFDPDLNPGL